jgi:hypothetical protein
MYAKSISHIFNIIIISLLNHLNNRSNEDSCYITFSSIYLILLQKQKYNKQINDLYTIWLWREEGLFYVCRDEILH